MTNATDQLSDIKEVLIVAAKSAISRLGSVLVNEYEVFFHSFRALVGMMVFLFIPPLTVLKKTSFKNSVIQLFK